MMSTPMIKGELQALLGDLAPGKKWPKRTRLRDLCDFAVATFSASSEDARQLRALELAHALRRNERR
jgi:hypothetical protein